MADEMRSTGRSRSTEDVSTGRGGVDPSLWENEDNYWRSNYSSRPYAQADRGYEFYRAAYRYGHDSATTFHGREWNDVEPELQSGWDRYEHRGHNRSAWEEIKDAVRDGWDRVRGKVR